MVGVGVRRTRLRRFLGLIILIRILLKMTSISGTGKLRDNGSRDVSDAAPVDTVEERVGFYLLNSSIGSDPVLLVAKESILSLSQGDSRERDGSRERERTFRPNYGPQERSRSHQEISESPCGS